MEYCTEVTIQKNLKQGTEQTTLEWIHCPICGNKTRVQLRKDTVLHNFPLHCPKCKNVSLIDARDMEIAVINE